MRNCRFLNGQDKGSEQERASGSNVDAPKKNHLYVVHSRGEEESSPDMVMI